MALLLRLPFDLRRAVVAPSNAANSLFIAHCWLEIFAKNLQHYNLELVLNTRSQAMLQFDSMPKKRSPRREGLLHLYLDLE